MSREFLKILARAWLFCALAVTPSRSQQPEKHEQTWPTPRKALMWCMISTFSPARRCRK
jgi:hypothetical protein